jgi:lipopolysaccharide biosynthesis glycosyltransferase
MNILICTSPEHIRYFLVTLQSLYENNPNEKFCVYIIYDRNKEMDWSPLEKQSDCFGAKIVPIAVDPGRFSDFPVLSPRWPRFIYYKVLAADLLPNHINRVLSLESDMIITKSIAELYQTDFEGNSIITTCRPEEGFEITFGSEKRKKQYLGIPQECGVFGGGMFLLNLEKIRSEPVSFERLIQLKYQMNNIWEAPEETLLYRLYCSSWKQVDRFAYNLRPIIWERQYSVEFTEQDKPYGTIVHYSGNIKPWDFYVLNYESELDKIWWKYAQKTQFHNEMRQRFDQRIQNHINEIYSRETTNNLYHNYQLLARWKFAEDFCGKDTLKNYLIKKGYRRIAIYGTNPFQILLFNELKRCREVSVVFLTDTFVHYENSPYPVHLASECEFNQVDAIIVSAFFHCDEIKQGLRHVTCPVIPIDQIIEELLPDDYNLYEWVFNL